MKVLKIVLCISAFVYVFSVAVEKAKTKERNIREYMQYQQCIEQNVTDDYLCVPPKFMVHNAIKGHKNH